MSVTVIGIDPSLQATGLCVWPSNGLEPMLTTIKSEAAKHGGGASPERQRYILGQIWPWLTGLVILPAVVMMEGLTPGAVGNVTDLAGFRALLAYGLTARGYVLVDHVRKVKTKNGRDTSLDPSGRGISPTSVKKFATGKGTASKDEMILAATKRFPNVKIANNNEADALWLADIGVVRDRGEADTKYRDEVLATLDWPL
jgi:Holliday junction resolvasome RuvABC endonuclease subunit